MVGECVGVEGVISTGSPEVNGGGISSTVRTLQSGGDSTGVRDGHRKVRRRSPSRGAAGHGRSRAGLGETSGHSDSVVAPTLMEAVRPKLGASKPKRALILRRHFFSWPSQQESSCGERRSWRWTGQRKVAKVAIGWPVPVRSGPFSPGAGDDAGLRGQSYGSWSTWPARAYGKRRKL